MSKAHSAIAPTATRFTSALDRPSREDADGIARQVPEPPAAIWERLALAYAQEQHGGRSVASLHRARRAVAGETLRQERQPRRRARWWLQAGMMALGDELIDCPGEKVLANSRCSPRPARSWCSASRSSPSSASIRRWVGHHRIEAARVGFSTDQDDQCRHDGRFELLVGATAHRDHRTASPDLVDPACRAREVEPGTLAAARMPDGLSRLPGPALSAVNQRPTTGRLPTGSAELRCTRRGRGRLGASRG
jgi:hypothetical protein